MSQRLCLCWNQVLFYRPCKSTYEKFVKVHPGFGNNEFQNCNTCIYFALNVNCFILENEGNQKRPLPLLITVADCAFIVKLLSS